MVRMVSEVQEWSKCDFHSVLAVAYQPDSAVLCESLPRCKGQQSCSFPLGAEGKLKNLQDANYDSSEAGTKFRYQHVLCVTLFAARFLSTSMPLYYLCLRFSVSVRAPAWRMRLQICLQCLWKSEAGTRAPLLFTRLCPPTIRLANYSHLTSRRRWIAGA